MTSNKKILISGAGISGLTLAYWLKKHGFSPTVIEKRPNLNNKGYMIDFYGSGFDVAEKMGLLDQLVEKSSQYPVKKLEFVDNKGKPRASLNIDKFRELLDHRYAPLLRGDLETVIYESMKEAVPVRFGASISNLTIHENNVDVTLDNGQNETYDLVVGADGIHSNVRKLLWGDESQFNHFLGFYVSCSVIDNFLGRQDTFYGHFEPNMQATIFSFGKDQLTVFFALRAEKRKINGRAEQIEMLAERLEHSGWIVPQLLEATKRSDDFFFDAVAQIHLDEWHKGRVALVGDACQCLTLLAGQGASMGMAGAYLLADELHKANGDYRIAFPAYQAKLKPEIEKRQKEARGLAGSFVPRNNFEIGLSHFFLNAAFLPGFSALFKKQIGSRSIIK
ncbi:MAG: FAD-dependent monooxygenase [Anaerolineales bacterium]|nr:MAG: FAD-dependent monooxygenase [Anaerolineales bacterium]